MHQSAATPLAQPVPPNREGLRLPWWAPRLNINPTVPTAGLLALILVALAAPLIAPHNPIRQSLEVSMLPPAWVAGGDHHYVLGTDQYGRDILSRLLFGARISLGVSALALLIGTAVGTPIGLVAGFVGGWLDAILMRLVDVLLSLPVILAALALAVALGPSFTNVVLVIGLLIWPRFARQVRGEASVLVHRDYVRYAKVIGVPSWLILLRHVLPNLLPTLLVISTLQIGHVILLEASLSFLGAGIPPPNPSWGVMVSEGTGLVATGWWISLFPGIAIVLTVLMFNSLGDWLRDHLDPRHLES